LKIFICGPTLYERCHIGHARIFIFFNFLIKFYRFIGHSPIAILQLTDIDHKIYQKNDYKNNNIVNIPDIYLEYLLKDLKKIQVENIFIYSRVSDFLSLIKKDVVNNLKINKGYSYAGNIYLPVSETITSSLGLTLYDVENMLIDISRGKSNQRDIMIWNSENFYEESKNKIDSINENNDRLLTSGIPGWHFQDYEVIKYVFNNKYDIHGGARELLYPHHEFIDEISKKINMNINLRHRNMWTHIGLVNINSEKMSNSSGNTISISNILKRYNPNTLKIFFLSTHYKKDIEFSIKDLDRADEIDKIISSLLLENYYQSKQLLYLEKQSMKKFLKFLNNDYDTESAMKLVLELIEKYQNPILINRMIEILGLKYY
jgi:cysteinyl-tRNA synthetase